MAEAGTVKVRKCDIRMFFVWESGCSGFWPSLLQPGLLDPDIPYWKCVLLCSFLSTCVPGFYLERFWLLSLLDEDRAWFQFLF